MSETDYYNRVRNLLAKAESTTPEEAEALTAKAEELIVKHSLDIARLLDRPADKLHVGSYLWKDYLGIGRRRLVGAIAMRLPGTTSRYWTTGRIHTVRVWSDDPAKLTLIQSALLQAELAMAVWWPQQSAEFRRKAYAAKNSYLWGFGAGMGQRIERASESSGGGSELVATSRRIERQVADEIGEAQIAKSATAPTMDGYLDGHNDGLTGLLTGRELIR